MLLEDSFIHFKMALARLKIIISILLYKQGTFGQQSGLFNGPPTAPNNVNQIFKSNPETTMDNLIQNQNGISGNIANNINPQLLSMVPQSTTSTQPTLLLPQTQCVSQPINHQLPQTSNFQQAFTVQPSLHFDTSLLLQSAGLQQPQNVQQPQNINRIPFTQQVPCTKQINSQQPINIGDINLQKQLPIASQVGKQIPVQSSQGMSIPNTAILSSSPFVSPTFNCPCQTADFINNLGANYLPSTASTYSLVETPQISTSYPTLPITAVLSTPTPIPLVTHSVMPYGTSTPDIFESPLRISNNFFIDDDDNILNKDSFTSLLLSLLRSPKKSSKFTTPSDLPGNLLPSYSNQGSKSSSIKSLLPLILNLLSERKECCGCREGCQNCERTRKNVEPKVYSDYSKKRDYSLKEEMFINDGPEEDFPRKVREHKKIKELKNTIPIVDTCENEGAEYDDCSEEEED